MMHCCECERTPCCKLGCFRPEKPIIFNGLFLMQYLDILGNVLPLTEFTIPYSIRLNGLLATILVPSFVIPLSTVPFVLVSVDGFIPQGLAPSLARYFDVIVLSTIPIVLHFFRDGTLRITTTGNAINYNPIPAGSYNIPAIDATWNTYIPNLPINNIRMTTGLTNLATISTNATFGFNYLEYIGLAYFANKLYSVSPTNDPMLTSLKPGNILDANLAFAEYSDDGTPIILNKPIQNKNTLSAEDVIAVNPTNPNNLVAVNSYLVNNVFDLVLPPGFTTFYETYSMDGGQTWIYPLNIVNVSPTPLSPEGFAMSDPRAIFDAYGNLYVVGITLEAITDTIILFVALSTDGGATFTLILNQRAPPQFWGYDYPMIATGPDGQGNQSLWIGINLPGSFQEALGFTSTQPIQMIGFRSTGLGLVTLVTLLIVPIIGGFYGGVFVADNGSVHIVGSTVGSATGVNALNVTNTSNATIWYAFNSQGLSGTFNGPIYVANSNTGFNESYPPQPVRNTWTRPVISGNRDALYIVYVDEPAELVLPTNISNIYFIYSLDGGSSWSAPIKLNTDDTLTTKFSPSISRDIISDNVAVSWLDCRNDPISDISTSVYSAILPRV